MKKISILLLTLILIFFASSCERTDNTINKSKESDQEIVSEQELQPLNIIFYSQKDDKLEAFQSNIDLEKGKISLSSDPLYTMTGHSTWSDVVPRFMSKNNLVLLNKPLSTVYDRVFIYEGDMSTFDTIYYEDYTLKYYKKKNTSEIAKKGKVLYENISMQFHGKNILPECFYVNQDGDIAVIGILDTSLPDTEIVTILFEADNGRLTVKKILEYPEIWDQYRLSKVQSPNTVKGFGNVCANPQKGTFIYNETTKIMELSPFDGKISCVISEEDVKSSIPTLDTRRPGYSFFGNSGLGFQNGYYIATFRAYNEVQGVYTVFFKSDGEYGGCILCQSDKITLYDNKGSILDSLSGEFYPLLYTPM